MINDFGLKQDKATESARENLLDLSKKRGSDDNALKRYLTQTENFVTPYLVFK